MAKHVTVLTLFYEDLVLNSESFSFQIDSKVQLFLDDLEYFWRYSKNQTSGARILVALCVVASFEGEGVFYLFVEASESLVLFSDRRDNVHEVGVVWNASKNHRRISRTRSVGSSEFAGVCVCVNLVQQFSGCW